MHLCLSCWSLSELSFDLIILIPDIYKTIINHNQLPIRIVKLQTKNDLFIIYKIDFLNNSNIDFKNKEKMGKWKFVELRQIHHVLISLITTNKLCGFIHAYTHESTLICIHKNEISI